MLTPEYLYRITEGAEEIASQLHTNIIQKIIERMMIRLGRGEDYLLTATDKWNIEVLQEARYLLEDIQKAKEIQEAMEDAGVQALQWDDKIYQAAGLSPVPLLQSPALMRIMQRNYEATSNTWKNMARTTANESQKLFIQKCDEAYNLVTSGAVSYSQSVRDAISDISNNGIRIKYPTGYEMSVESATMMIVRTGISQCTAEVTLARAKEMGVKYVITSSHLGARPTHEPWQGKVFSVDWSKIKI